MAATTPLANLTDLEARVGPLAQAQKDRVDGLIAGATARVRGYTRQDISLVTDDVAALRSSGPKIILPQRPAVSVSAVAAIVGDGSADIALSGWTFDDIDTIDLHGQYSTTNAYRVTYTHGLNPVPELVIDVIANMVNRVLTSPSKTEGIAQQNIGQFGQQFQQGTGSQGTGVRLFQSDKNDLAEAGYRPRATSTVLSNH